MKITLAGAIKYDSVVDGVGLRSVIYTQGCNHRCRDCHNPETWEFGKGKVVDTDDIVWAIKEDVLNQGVTFSGGDPFEQAKECLDIVQKVKDYKKSIWAYSGYLFEDLINEESKEYSEDKYNFLKSIDVLVDGRFITEEKTLSLKYRGSKNQRIIDVQKSLQEKSVILYDVA